MIEDMRAGLAPASTYAVNRAQGSEPLGPLDFYPWHKRQDIAAAPVDLPAALGRFDPSSSAQADAAQKIFSLSTPG